ncbi:MAG: ribokinase, partial [Proteobacteria bacterium]|nr:ribokinase [Pseudomonadota bacterium]
DLPPTVWPEAVPGFREAFEALYEGLDETGRLLLRALAATRPGAQPSLPTRAEVEACLETVR